MHVNGPQGPLSLMSLAMRWTTSRFDLDLTRTQVMGIVNLTPDSFSDGGQHTTPSQALRHAERLIKEGADLLDVGGESTRPGAPSLPLEVELDRVMPVLRELMTWGIPISVDTYKPDVMRAALDLGVDVINDIWGLRQSGALEAVAAYPRCGVCLMHMHREPRSMQMQTMEGQVVERVRDFLAERVQALQVFGIEASRIMLDPGIGFGKTVAQNFELLRRQDELLTLGFPLLVGWSRKSSLGHVCGLAQPQDRVVPSVAAALLAVERGAHVVRVHDVRDTLHALEVWRAVRGEPSSRAP